ncbi:hypothetical protein OAA64_01900 [bacterium]|nr:hypothetical protein [bacterium]
MRKRVEKVKRIADSMSINELEKIFVSATLFALGDSLSEQKEIDAWFVEKKMASDALESSSLIIDSIYSKYIHCHSNLRAAVSRVSELNRKIDLMREEMDNLSEEIQILKG